VLATGEGHSTDRIGGDAMLDAAGVVFLDPRHACTLTTR
jgi:hypothetical protein